jgi:DNA-binding MarR family transcriptional regulator
MAVNRVTDASDVKKPPRGAREGVVRPRLDSAVTEGEPVSRDDVQEVLRLLVGVVTGLKRGRDEVPSTLQDAFESGGLGPRHVPVLMAVALGDGPMSVSEIAGRIGLSLATTSLMVGELDRHGVVVRAEDERDRRRTMVRMHDDHRAIVDKWSQERFSPIARALGRMSAPARKHFVQGLGLLVEETQPCAEAPDDGAGQPGSPVGA